MRAKHRKAQVTHAMAHGVPADGDIAVFDRDLLDDISPATLTAILADIRRNLGRGATVDVWGILQRECDAHPLHFAATYGIAELAKTCLSKGCDVNSLGDYGATPLCAAAYAGQVECLLLLVYAGADIDARDREGRSALDSSRSHECSEILRSAELVKREREELTRTTPIAAKLRRSASL